MTADAVIIRPLAPGDAPKLLKVANDLIREDTYLMLSGKKLTLSKEEAYIKDALDKVKKQEKIHIVAVVGDAIVGSAEVRRGEKRKRHVGEIGIAILGQYRGRGLGALLFRELIKRSKAMGLRMLMLHCFENNVPAMELYKKFGFTKCGVLPDAYSWRGSYIGEVTMYKMLV